jgi:hypothetical protein
MLGSIAASDAERQAPRAGDSIVPRADVVMDRAFTIHGSPEAVWPWLVQLGKGRAGWYLPSSIERLLPRSRRAARTIEDRWQNLGVGDVIPDYGGRHETFQVAEIQPPSTLVYRSRRGSTDVTWSLTLGPDLTDDIVATRIFLRLRIAPVRHRWLAVTAGELLDLLTIAGLAAGLRERLGAREQPA